MGLLFPAANDSLSKIWKLGLRQPTSIGKVCVFSVFVRWTNAIFCEIWWFPRISCSTAHRRTFACPQSFRFQQKHFLAHTGSLPMQGNSNRCNVRSILKRACLHSCSVRVLLNGYCFREPFFIEVMWVFHFHRRMGFPRRRLFRKLHVFVFPQLCNYTWACWDIKTELICNRSKLKILFDFLGGNCINFVIVTGVVLISLDSQGCKIGI